MIPWETCKDDFRPDGSLRDIYISPATVADWNTIFQWLKKHNLSEYSLDGAAKPMPDSVELAFAARHLGSPLLRHDIGPTCINFHFFTEEEIECDFIPNDIESQHDLDVLLSFMRQIARLIGREAIMTGENWPAKAFIKYSPERDCFSHEPLALR